MNADTLPRPDDPDPRRIATKADFGRELSLAKERAGVSVRDLAKAVGAPVSTVGGYFAGRHLPALRPNDQLTRILDVCAIEGPEAELWRQALRRARRASGEHASPSSTMDTEARPTLPPLPTDHRLAQPERSPLVSIRPPVDRLAQWPTVRGRDALLARLDRDLDRIVTAHQHRDERPARTRVVVLHGLGGSGKSTIALRAAGRALERGIRTWWVSAADPDALLAGMQALCVELGADPDQFRTGSPPDAVWRVLQASEAPWLLVIDNADDPPATLALPHATVADGTGWVRSIHSGLGLVLVTSRDGGAVAWGSKPPPWLDLLPVRPLEPGDGGLVLAEMAGGGAGSPDDAQALARRLGGLPLALYLAGRHIAEAATIPPAFAGSAPQTFRAYEQALGQGRYAELFDAGAARDAGGGDLVGRTWELSLDLLAGRGLSLARPLLRLLSCMGPAPVACGLILRAPIMSRSRLFGEISGRMLWETLRALAELGIVDLYRQETADPDLADVVVPHQLVRDTSRHHPDVRADIGAYLTLITDLIIEAATRLEPRDPSTWARWRALVDHCASPLDLAVEFAVSPRAIPPGMLVAATLSARYLRVIGELDRAEVAYARTARLGVVALGEDDPRVLAIQHDLGRVWYDLGRLHDALNGLSAVLAARARVLGSAHPDTLTTQHYLARTLRDAGQVDKAALLFRRTLTARRAALGEEHLDTLTSRNNVADTLRAQGHLDRAGAELRAVIEARTRVLGPEHPATLVARYNLARVAHDRDDLDGAQTQLESLVDTYVRVLGPDHPRTLLSRQAQIDVWHDQGLWQRALADARDVLARRLALLGPRHPATLVTRHRLGLLLVDLGNYDEAEIELAEVLADRRLVLGPRHLDTLAVRGSLDAVRSRRPNGRRRRPVRQQKVIDPAADLSGRETGHGPEGDSDGGI